jgi:hypothetical protein
MLARIS